MAAAARIDEQPSTMHWGMSDLATLWALIAAAATSLVGVGAWKSARGVDYGRTIQLLKDQISALELDVARNKVLVEQSTREVFNVNVRFEQQQVNYRALGAKFLEATGRIDWLEKRERQLVRVLEHHDIDVPEPEDDVEW